ncbi:MAG: DUF4197 domain-containing protein [Gammaproteobacteria bacterium]|nr:DUF4197 domain-containing protein [Gammaproteobacteria bacterium]
MKNCKKFIALMLVVFSFSTSQANAADSWWDSIVDKFKTPGENKVSKELNIDEIDGAFKGALRIASENVVKKLGSADGFNNDAAVHIPLPKELNTVKKALAKIGMSDMVDDLELKLNRAAEAATPKAKELFLQSITEMTFEDVNSIYKGPEDSATKYFQEKMSTPLNDAMHPIVKDSLSKVGAIQAFDKVMGRYQALPFVPDVKTSLAEHVVQKGMDGIFYYIAKEESAIRNDPAKQTTDLLKKVFGAK